MSRDIRGQVLAGLFGSRVRVRLMVWLLQHRGDMVTGAEAREQVGSSAIYQMERLEPLGILTDLSLPSARGDRVWRVEPDGPAEPFWALCEWIQDYLDGKDPASRQ